MISEACKSLKYRHNFCIKTIYIQSKSDFVQYDIDTNIQYMDLSASTRLLTPIVFTNNYASINKQNAITIYKDESQYNVICHSGTIVRIHKNGHSIYITPSKLDFGNVRGLLSNYDGDSSNDFTVKLFDMRNNFK